MDSFGRHLEEATGGRPPRSRDHPRPTRTARPLYLFQFCSNVAVAPFIYAYSVTPQHPRWHLNAKYIAGGELLVRQLAKRSPGLALGLGGLALALIVGAVVVSIYVFGAGGNKPTTANGIVSVPTLATNGDTTRFTIDGSSKATFTIGEILFGQPNTVVGETDQVVGQILVNQNDPSQSKVGAIKIDVSTLATDNDLRNRTLRGRILQTDDPANQYATFVAKSISGLPSSIAVGQTVSFKITGDLTIHQATKTVTFDTQVTVVSDQQLTGKAQATVKYSDFNIAIPNVPSVSGVDDTVTLALDFTANAG